MKTPHTPRQRRYRAPRLWRTGCTFLAALAIQCAISTVAAEVMLPDFGDTSESALSVFDERRLGEAFMRRVRQSLKIVDDPEINDYIQSLGEKLAARTDGASGPFTFFVVDDPAINAFAAPGGFIGIHSGLILATRSESELAAVIAHEIAHVTQRHIARSVEAAQRMTIPAAAALLAALLLGGQGGDVARAAVAVTAAGQAQQQINFTRANEQEADRVGMQVLAGGGFDPGAMPAFFERLQQAARFMDQRLPELLRTHPVTEARIAESRARAEQHPKHRGRDHPQYALTVAKQRVLSARDPTQAAAHFRQVLRESGGPERAAARYGYAAALLEQRNFSAARKAALELLAEDRDRIAYVVLLAEIELESGNVPAALEALHEALKLYPRSHPLTVHYARALLRAGRANDARVLLQDYVGEKDVPEPELYQLLAQAQRDAGRAAEAHESMAEYYYLMGRLPLAIEQLKLAQGLARGDFYRASRIESQLKQLEQEVALEKKSGRF